MKVQITSSKLITPSSPTPSHPQSLQFSSLDQLFRPNHYVPVVFYYPANDEECRVDINAERSLRLLEALSETLNLYYPLAGRFTTDDLSMECNDKGAEYLEAKVNGSLSQFLIQTQPQNHELVPQNGSFPLIVQFNMFVCGGLAIGILTSHRIADGFSGFTFIHAWATSCRIGVNKVLRYPDFSLASICPPRDMASIKESLVLFKATSNKILTKMFVFEGAAISNLRSAAISSSTAASSSGLPKNQLTRLKVVMALIWRTLIRMAQAKHGRMRPSLLKLPISLRRRTNLPIAENSCGNLYSWLAAEFMPNDASCCDVRFYDLVGRIHNAIETTVSNYTKASSGGDLFSMVMDDFRKVNEAMKETEEVDFYMFSCWCGFPLYEADFGWGKPTRVCSGLKLEREAILLLDTKDGNGIEAWVSLEENNMLLFQQDPDIIAFSKNCFCKL